MTRRKDWLVHQLPVGMVEDDFLVGFLRIFQDVADTVLHQVDTLPHMFDPMVAPDPMVRAMGAWIGVDFIDSSLPETLQRGIVREYSSLLPWRGTRFGLERLLTLISGSQATVEDNGGVSLAPLDALSEDTDGDDFADWEPDNRPNVRMSVESAGWASDELLLRIVRNELPAWATFELKVGDRIVWPTASGAGISLPEELPTIQMATTAPSADLRELAAGGPPDA